MNRVSVLVNVTGNFTAHGAIPISLYFILLSPVQSKPPSSQLN